jgi:hypothetical protein
LDFEGLAQRLVNEGHHHDTAKARDEFLLNPIEKAIETIKKQLPKITIELGHDDYILESELLEDIFISLDILTSIKIPPSKFGFIPIQIAIGIVDNMSSSRIISNDSAITFLKNDILKPYRKYFKENYSEPQSFVVITNPLYESLDRMEREQVRSIEYEHTNINNLAMDYIKERAHVKVLCSQIGLPGIYSRINDVYVEPLNYQIIKDKLVTNRVVFLTGDAESGKTYTAIRLLWEFYEQGYKPIYFFGRIKDERTASSFGMVSLGYGVKHKQIIYFEDPFGRNYYQRNEILERQFANSLSEINKSKDTYVIVTSRSEVYKEFKQHYFESDIYLENFIITLNFHTGYDYQKRVALLKVWAAFKSCKWFHNDTMTEFVIEYMKDKSKLPTPLAITNFIVQSSNIENTEKLTQLIHINSKGTAKAFAEEIRELSDDKIIFLCIILISDEFELHFIQTKYNSLIQSLRIRDGWSFNRLSDWWPFRRK